jgi:NADH-quinone oxidoreductase subunit J
MTPDILLFLILAAVAVAAAIGMLVSRSAVYSALFLILNFSVVAVFYLVLGSPFIAMSQITVYAGAIMVLFLFVIMLMGADQLPGEDQGSAWQRPLAIFLGAVLLVSAGYVILFRLPLIVASAPPSASFYSPAALGEMLFSGYLLPFEVTSVLLLVAMVGAIVLTQRKARKRAVEPKN